MSLTHGAATRSGDVVADGIESLVEISTRVRDHILQLAALHPVHLGASLSVTDILVSLYLGNRLTMDGPDESRDRVILSKGHAVAALYFVLSEAGILNLRPDEVGLSGTTRAGHATEATHGIEISTGSLGHGLSVGIGIALGLSMRRARGRVCVVLGDGELNEGSVWEAALFAAHRSIRNLVAVIDRNRLQQSGASAEILEIEPLEQKWHAFGWRVRTVDGHDHQALLEGLDWALQSGDPRPPVIVAETTKAKGVPFMEGDMRWHHVQLSDDELQAARRALRQDGD